MCFPRFSYKHYEAIIKRHREQIVDYSDCLTKPRIPEDFTVLRHDVEFSVNRALQLAYVENDLGVSSTYLFQSCSSAYNVASVREADRIRKIAELGHKVGLHFYLPDNFDLSNLECEIMRQRYIDVARNFSDTSKAAARLGWRAEVSLHDGLRRTLRYFLNQKNQ